MSNDINFKFIYKNQMIEIQKVIDEEAKKIS